MSGETVDGASNVAGDIQEWSDGLQYDDFVMSWFNDDPSAVLGPGHLDPPNDVNSLNDVDWMQDMEPMPTLDVTDFLRSKEMNDISDPSISNPVTVPPEQPTISPLALSALSTPDFEDIHPPLSFDGAQNNDLNQHKAVIQDTADNDPAKDAPISQPVLEDGFDQLRAAINGTEYFDPAKDVPIDSANQPALDDGFDQLRAAINSTESIEPAEETAVHLNSQPALDNGFDQLRAAINGTENIEPAKETSVDMNIQPALDNGFDQLDASINGTVSIDPSDLSKEIPVDVTIQPAAGVPNNGFDQRGAAINGSANTGSTEKVVIDLTGPPVAETLFPRPVPSQTAQLAQSSSGFPQYFGAQNIVQPENMWTQGSVPRSNHATLMNNGTAQSLQQNFIPWHRESNFFQAFENGQKNPMTMMQPIQTPQGMVYGFGTGVPQGPNLDLRTGLLNNAQPGGLSQPMPKRKVSGQAPHTRRVSPSNVRMVLKSINQTAPGPCLDPRANTEGKEQQFPSPESWAASRTWDRPDVLKSKYEKAMMNTPRKADSLESLERVAVYDRALSEAYILGGKRCLEALNKKLTHELATHQQMFGLNVQWPANFNRTMVGEQIRSYTQESIIPALVADGPAAAGMIREHRHKFHSGLFITPGPQPELKPNTTATPRKRKQKASATAAAEKEAVKPARTAKAKAKATTITTVQGMTPTSEEEQQAPRGRGDAKRVLDGNDLKVVLDRTLAKHEREGTTFELTEKPTTSTPHAQSERASEPSATAQQKRKAAQETGDEPAAKKPASAGALQLPQAPKINPSQTNALLLPQAPKINPTQTNASKTFHNDLALPIPEIVPVAPMSMTATTAANGAGEVTEPDEANAESQCIKKLLQVENTLPVSLIQDFRSPKKSSMHAVVRDAAIKGLGDQSHLLFQPSIRAEALRTYDAKQREFMNVNSGEYPEWNASVRNKEKRDRKKAAQMEAFKAARASRDNIDDKTTTNLLRNTQSEPNEQDVLEVQRETKISEIEEQIKTFEHPDQVETRYAEYELGLNCEAEGFEFEQEEVLVMFEDNDETMVHQTGGA
ncbi:hypothetical protein HJFPF1_07920 [Paramyrothecium foliicola]|nr:hypothetical protein HJFPF1_07920 [Paramyrothecium foliicola]